MRENDGMSETIDVYLSLTRDKPNTMNFEDTYSGLPNAWYKFESDAGGNISLFANEEGFEHLARYFLKMARTEKCVGYHAHHPLELGRLPEGPELTIMLANEPR
jgi:hypothetical protein